MFKTFTTKLYLTQTVIEIHNPKKIQIRKLELRIFRVKQFVSNVNQAEHQLQLEMLHMVVHQLV